MRVGLDARKLWDGGIGTYIRHLVAAAAVLEPPTRYTLFVDPEARPHPWPPGSGVCPVRAGKYSIAEHVVLARAARAAGVDLYHAPHYTLPLTWRGPAIVTIHDLIHLRFPQFFPPGVALYARAVAGLAARRARLVLADSEDARGDIVGLLGVPAARVRVIPLGVSPALGPRSAEAVAAFRRARGLPSGYLLYVGARKRHKNLETVFEALRRLGPDAPPLVLAGDPWHKGGSLARAAARAGLGSRVVFAGETLDDAALAGLYGGAAALVQPSLIEGFGLPPLEAMACAVPVIASDIGALRETLAGAAVLVAPTDADAWAAAIGQLLGDGDARAALARGGPARAARYRWERTATLTCAAYEEALGGKA